MFSIFLLFLTIETSTSKSLPSFITKCSESDLNLRDCLDKSVTETTKKFKMGYKDLGIASLDPFLIKQIDLGNTTSGAVSLHQVYNNMNIFGLTDFVMSVTDANFTGNNCHWKYDTFNPKLRLEADYIMKGQLLLFPINGHGKCVNILYDSNGTYAAKCERYTKRNKTFLRVTEFLFDIKPKKLVIDYENIIDGNEQVSKEVVKTLNENIDSIYPEVSPAFNQVMGAVWKQTLNQVFSRVSEDELFMP